MHKRNLIIKKNRTVPLIFNENGEFVKKFGLIKCFSLITVITQIISAINQGSHQSSTSKFPDFLQFSIPPDRSIKIVFIFYFNGANCITSNLRVTLKGKNLLPREQILFLKNKPPMRTEMGLDYVMRKSIHSPLEQNK